MEEAGSDPRGAKTPSPFPAPCSERPRSPTAGDEGGIRTIKEVIYSIGNSIRSPVVIHQPVPAYTPEAKAAKIEGTVLLQVIIRKDGTVSDASVVRGLGLRVPRKSFNSNHIG